MNTADRMSRRFGPGGQRGVATLMLTLVVLVGLTLVTFYSARVGLMNQRIAANEVRAREAFEAAEAGVEGAVGFLKINKSLVASTGAGGWVEEDQERWVECADGDTDLPCGDGASNVYASDSMMLRYQVGGTTTIASGVSDLLSNHATPQVGDQPMEVYLLARCADGDPDEPSTQDGACDDLNSNADSFGPSTLKDSAFVVIAQGWSADQTGTATVQQGLTLYQIPASAPDSPITIRGTANISGSFEVVANPDGGGAGVPLSVWSDQDIIISTSTTCHVAEYLTTPVQPSDITPADYDGEEELFCSTCRCTDASMSEAGIMSSNATGEDLDVLDNESASGNPHEGVNPDSTYFPPDLFEYALGTPRADWRDVFDQAERLTAGCGIADLNAGSSGLYWVDTTDCALGANQVVGSPEAPVLIVVDEVALSLQGGAVIYGFVYSFDKNNDGTGGSITVNGTATVNGAMMADYPVTLSNGNVTIRYSKKLLERMMTLSGAKGLGKRPGTWLDYL